MLHDTFRSLGGRNYRLWAGGALLSNLGTWVQRTAQDWLVLTQLTEHNATALGVVMALQFGPHILLLPLTGLAADRFDRRRLLMVTQTLMGSTALGLGLLTVTGHVQLWHVDVFAFLLGCATAFDSPANQTFVGELVGEEHLSNAVALNSTSFNLARMVGPALAGVLLSTVGSGWAFLINAASYGGVLLALARLRVHELHRNERAAPRGGGLLEGMRYVARRPDLSAVMVMLFLIGTFGLNFAIFISTMAVGAFRADASGYGLLMSIMAVGTISGSLLAARRARPRIELLLHSAVVFGAGCTLAALMPGYWLFGAMLIPIGVSALTFANSSNSLLQLATAPAMRGRVMAMRLAITLGGTPIGAPLVGWVADRFGPRWALGVGAASGFAAALVLLRYLVRYRQLRLERTGRGWRVSMDGDAELPLGAGRPA